MAQNIAPGVNRNFAAERWDALPQSAWAQERERARDLVKRDVHFQAYGSDIDADALELAKANALRAGVQANIAWKQADLRDFAPETEKRAGSFAILPMASECSIFSRPMNYIELWGKSLTKNADGVIILLAHLNNLNLCSAEELIKGGSYIMV